MTKQAGPSVVVKVRIPREIYDRMELLQQQIGYKNIAAVAKNSIFYGVQALEKAVENLPDAKAELNLAN